MYLKSRVQRVLQHAGWDLHRVTVDRGLDTYLAMLLEELRVNCVLDVGARYGEYGSMLRRIGYQGRIVSFEPIEGNFEVLARTSAADRKWHALAIALGREDTTREINVMSSSNFSSFLAPNDYGSRFEGNDIMLKQAVDTRRLDSVAEKILAGIDEPRVYLKMDTQGWDLEVIAGALGCLDCIVACQSEMSLQPIYERMPSYSDAIDTFRSLGFAPSAIFPVTRDTGLRLVEFDCVMVRA